VRELKEELEALNGVLETLQEMASNIDVDLTMLQIPLLQYGKTCKDVEAVIVKFITHSYRSWTSFRDWTKLIYLGEDISGLRNMLVGYKSTFMIALRYTNM